MVTLDQPLDQLFNSQGFSEKKLAVKLAWEKEGLLVGEAIRACLGVYPLVMTNVANWKDPPFF